MAADLPVVEEIIDPKEVQNAPEDWRLIGAEVSEQLDYEPGHPRDADYGNRWRPPGPDFGEYRCGE